MRNCNKISKMHEQNYIFSSPQQRENVNIEDEAASSILKNPSHCMYGPHTTEQHETGGSMRGYPKWKRLQKKAKEELKIYVSIAPNDFTPFFFFFDFYNVLDKHDEQEQ